MEQPLLSFIAIVAFDLATVLLITVLKWPAAERRRRQEPRPLRLRAERTAFAEALIQPT